MRHNKKVNHLGRQSSHRKAMMANMASSLIIHKRIETTTAKAKALKKYVEPLITKAKEDTTHQRRIVFSYLRDKEAVTELFREVAPKVGDRPGGYTRILKTGFRLGDAADMCIIELVDFNESYVAGATPEAKAKTRRGRSGAKKAETAPAAEAPVAENADAPAPVAEEAATPVVEKAEAPAEKKPVPAKPAAEKKAAPAKAAAAKKPATAKTQAPKVSGAKTTAVKTGTAKKS